MVNIQNQISHVINCGYTLRYNDNLFSMIHDLIVYNLGNNSVYDSLQISIGKSAKDIFNLYYKKHNSKIFNISL